MQRPSISISLALVSLIVGFGGCKSKPPEPATTTSPQKATALATPAPSAEDVQTPTVHAHMEEHYAKAQTMKQSVIVGTPTDESA